MTSSNVAGIAFSVQLVSDSANITPETGLWKIVDVSGKGKGVVTTKRIAPGTLLMSEAPLITTDCVISIETTEQDLARAFTCLSKESQQALLSLHSD